VLKAYRDLEREGLAEGRPGLGTFVRRLPPGPPATAFGALARGLERWVRNARDAGLDDESIQALVQAALRAGDNEVVA
jgi:DNA-binding transcriptional regulator YhcF (GntR family)